MQLVAYGAQDIYLTGNPQITFFKVVYRRHTNFSMEAIEQTWNGGSDGSDGNGRCTATISRNGDLVHRMYLQFDVKEDENFTGRGVCNPGAFAVRTIELEIGGQKIDKHSGQWMETWAELTNKNEAAMTMSGEGAGKSHQTGTLFQRMSGMGGVAPGIDLTTAWKEAVEGDDAEAQVDAVWELLQLAEGIYFVPLQFWFCRNPGLALPLIALQYHEVKVILEHNMKSAFGTESTNQLWCDYIYLDTDERRRFAQVSHEYLIEQVQEQSVTPLSSANIDINFNHPVKFLALSANFENTDVDTSEENIGGPRQRTGISLVRPFKGKAHLKLNGHDRFAPRDSRYFTRTQVYEHFSGPGGLDSGGGATTAAADAGGGPFSDLEDPDSHGQMWGGPGRFSDGIAVYSFALKPEEHQPSGTCNFSRIDNAQFITAEKREKTSDMVLYAVNYNVLRIMSGMGGLAYSN